MSPTHQAVCSRRCGRPSRRIRLRPRVWVSACLLVRPGVWRSLAVAAAGTRHRAASAISAHGREHPHHAAAAVDSLGYQSAKCCATRVWPALSPCSTIGTRFRSANQDAFELHPWVASVERITQTAAQRARHRAQISPAGRGRRIERRTGVTFLPIDEHAVRLPEGDLTEAERRYLPRISGVTGRPLVGDTWDDPRVVGGAKLAAALADVWQQLRLVEILAHVEPSSPDGETRMHVRDHHQRRHAHRLGRGTRAGSVSRRIAVRPKATAAAGLRRPARPARIDRRPRRARRPQRAGHHTTHARRNDKRRGRRQVKIVKRCDYSATVSRFFGC